MSTSMGYSEQLQRRVRVGRLGGPAPRDDRHTGFLGGG